MFIVLTKIFENSKSFISYIFNLIYFNLFKSNLNLKYNELFYLKNII